MSFIPRKNAESDSKSKGFEYGKMGFTGVDIPVHESIHGSHLKALKEIIGCTNGDFLPVVGLSTARSLFEIFKEPEAPIDNLVIANLVRWYYRHPEYLPEVDVDFQALFDRLEKLPIDTSKEAYETVFHRRYPTIEGFAIEGQGKEPSQTIKRMAILMISMPDEDLIEFWNMSISAYDTQFNAASKWRAKTGQTDKRKHRSDNN